MVRSVRTWIAWSAAYFVVSFAVALVAHGTDLDQLTSRSALSRAAAVVDRLLWAPYHWVGRQLPPAAVRMPATTPLLLLTDTLAWGASLAAASRMLTGARTRSQAT